MGTAPAETLETAAALAPGSIVIARHGRPDVDRTVRIDWRGYVAWWADYERAGLAPGQTPPDALRQAVERAEVFLASDKPRAFESAEALAAGRSVRRDAIFTEAPLPPPPFWGLKRPGVWGVYARIFWWLGRSAGEESRREAEERARAAVEALTQEALAGRHVALFAHGWFNRMMRPLLKRQGWVETANSGDGYWAFRSYERVR